MKLSLNALFVNFLPGWKIFDNPKNYKKDVFHKVLKLQEMRNYFWKADLLQKRGV